MRSKGAEFVWLDGKFVKWEDATIPVMSHSLHYGTAVFEGIRAYSTESNLFVFRLEDHMKRLHQSASIYCLELHRNVKELCDATVKLAQKIAMKRSCYIRPLAFVGLHGIDLNITRESPTHTVIIIFPFERYFNEEGIRACISSWRRIHDNSSPPLAKAAGNYLNSVLATQECKRNGYDESIMLDIYGNVSEASGENIFLVKNNQISTPSIANSSLEGITRDTAMIIARRLGHSIVERPITRTELYMADEVFLTGTAAEIVGITHLDGKPICDGKEGPLTKKIREMYAQIVSGRIEEYMEWLTPVW
jgi:branched-chain amino acid aminotransferase